MQPTGLYRFTSIARPVDPAYPTNRALLALLPVLAIAGALASIAGVGAASPQTAALGAVLSGFGAWAVARELAPDDNPAAFVSLVFAFGAQIAWGPATVIPMFITLVLTRIVNRTTGVPPKWFETLLLLGFVTWAMARLGDPLIGIAATVAFFLDASLSRPARWQLLTGMVCLFAALYFVLRDGVGMPAMFASGDAYLAVALVVLSMFAVLLLGTRDVLAVGDVSLTALDPARVRGGMFIALFVAAAAPRYNVDPGINPLLLAVIGGVVASRLLTWFNRRSVGTGASGQGR